MAIPVGSPARRTRGHGDSAGFKIRRQNASSARELRVRNDLPDLVGAMTGLPPAAGNWAGVAFAQAMCATRLDLRISGKDRLRRGVLEDGTTPGDARRSQRASEENMLRHTLAAGAVSVGVLAATQAATAAAPTTPLLSRLTHVTNVGSTVPGNGDVNPYGIVKVKTTRGALQAGDLLISNFNDKANQQGTGTTIVQLSPSGHRTLFAHITDQMLPGPCPGGVGLTTALDVLPGGYVVVGSLPTSDGTSATAQVGCLIVLDSTGKPVSTISGSMIQGPWDSTVVTKGSISSLFVSMALVGGSAAGRHTVDNSTVVRIRLSSGAGHAPKVMGETVVADKIPRRDDPNALVIGPTGLALAPGGRLYVADTLDNRIAAVANATTRMNPAADAGATVSTGGHLNQPLGLTLAPNGDVIAANAGDGNMVEISPGGRQVATRTVDTKTGAGSLFGLVAAPSGKRIYFVDDGDNTLKVLH